MKWIGQTGYYNPRKRVFKVSTIIIILCVLFYLFSNISYKFYHYLSLSYSGLFGNGMIWQLVTYQFLHGGFFHLFFNMFVVYIFGRELEGIWGKKFFVFYYLTCGVVGGILASLLTPYPIIGASGAVYGLLIAYGLIYPNRYLYIYFLFPVKAKYFVGFLAVLEFFSTLSKPGDGIAHSAHLAGMIAGFIILKLRGKLKKYDSDKWHREFLRNQEFEQEVDRILAKLHTYGEQSLTERERKVLDEASRKFRDNQDNDIFNSF